MAVAGPVLAAIRPRLLRPRRADLALSRRAWGWCWRSSTCSGPPRWPAAAPPWPRSWSTPRAPSPPCSGSCCCASGWGGWAWPPWGCAWPGARWSPASLEGGPVHGDAAGVTHGARLRRPVRALHRAGAGRRPPRHRPLDHGAVRLRGQRAGASSSSCVARTSALPGARPGCSDLLRLGPSAAGWAVLFGLAAGPTLLGLRPLQRLAPPPPQRRGQPGAHAGAGAHRRHRLPAPGRADHRAGAPGERGDPGGVVLLRREGAGSPAAAPLSPGGPPAAPPPAPARPRSCRRRSGPRRRRGSGAAWKLEPGTPASPCSTTSPRAKPESSRSERAE